MPGTLIIIYVFMLAPLFRVSQEVDLGHHQPGTRSRCWLAIREKSASHCGWGLGTEGRCTNGIQCLPEIEQRQLKLIGWRRLYYLLLITISIDTPVCIQHKYMRTQSRHSTSHQKRRTWEYKCGGRVNKRDVRMKTLFIESNKSQVE